MTAGTMVGMSLREKVAAIPCHSRRKIIITKKLAVSIISEALCLGKA